MSTGIQGSMLDSLAAWIVEIDARYDVHTVTLVLNGQHGEFDLTVLASDVDLEDQTWQGVLHRHGGVSDMRRVGVCRFCGLEPYHWHRPCAGVSTGSHEPGEWPVAL